MDPGGDMQAWANESLRVVSPRRETEAWHIARDMLHVRVTSMLLAPASTGSSSRHYKVTSHIEGGIV
jgi:hypothetical protein